MLFKDGERCYLFSKWWMVCMWVYFICLRFGVRVFVLMCVDNACFKVGMRCFLNLHSTRFIFFLLFFPFFLSKVVIVSIYRRETFVISLNVFNISSSCIYRRKVVFAHIDYFLYFFVINYI